ncbi:MAG: hypothetical protein Q8O83_02750 [bacterium]|nr:hypothetical protein [bacterium]
MDTPKIGYLKGCVIGPRSQNEKEESTICFFVDGEMISGIVKNEFIHNGKVEVIIHKETPDKILISIQGKVKVIGESSDIWVERDRISFGKA